MKKLLILAIVIASIFVLAYTVRPGDVLNIVVFEHPEFPMQVTVSVDGTISYPFVGQVNVVGKTTNEIAEIIKDSIKKIIKNPIVSVYIEKYAPMYVYVQGALNVAFDISIDPEMTLSKLVSFLNLSTNTSVDFSNVKIKRGKEIFNVDLESYYNGANFDVDVLLKEGDIIYIPKQKSKVAYIVGPVKEPGEFSFSDTEDITLSLLIAKAGGVIDEKKKYIKEVEVIEDEISRIYPPDILEKDLSLKRGAVVNIKTYSEFYVYSEGQKIEFLPDEPKTLKMLLAKKPTRIDRQELINDGFAIINGKIKVKLSDDIDKISLSCGDVVDLIYTPFTVNVVGYKGGVITLTSKEPRTLSYLVKKLGIDNMESILDIYVVGDKEYKIEDLILNKIDKVLEKNDTVVIKSLAENAVYLVGDVSRYVVFPYSEKITLHKVLAKAGVSNLKRIEKIKLNGKILDTSKDEVIESGAILNVILKKPIYVTAMGYIRNRGTVKIDYTESPDLITLFGKLGGLYLGPNLYFVSDKVYVVRKSKVFAEVDARDVYEGKKNIELENGDFVFVTEKEIGHVYAFGYGKKDGIVKFNSSEEFDLKTLLAKLGGIEEGISKKITILFDNEATTVKWDENVKLKSGATVLFEKDTENYIYVIDENGKPNMFYAVKPITLYELISNFNVNKNFRLIKILNKDVSIDVNDVEKALGYVVKPGDVVKIVDAPQNIAYVLGEVKNPGVISLNDGMDVLEAVIRAGYFTDNAAPSSVFLYKGGVNGTAIKVNLNDAIKKNGSVPKVEPGDVVYVPSDPFKTALEWVPVINNLIGLYNNIKTIK
ncbi:MULTISPECIES: polysaccharide biosynthesis/export family protein [unclassified Thermosipho (in: thermotogales)]|uniref:polysaccharide biosynthesis/export family protein n=1 Tax=unclassified Thermosipho (in: thermotogales) TaxID=2676525 RepID=UPI000986BCB5|nr:MULTISPECIES: polysaccharide biosynthesis/export family protein [unclassified Thermosipho (in: thermotogales)]MBT1247774.1 hypothetical protein [Thermosipho sp. 1244]OOC46998.1 hypothetical protein XO09_03790 [Thermosipho sp. 1223]